MQNMPPTTRNLLLINTLVFVLTLVMPRLTDIGGLHFFMASDFNPLQLLSYMFLHASFTHILFNMFALWMFGRTMESVWGPRKFLVYYFVCGIGAGLIQEVAQFFQFYFIMSEGNAGFTLLDTFAAGEQLSHQLNAWTTVGASGAVYGILLAFGMTFPNERIFIFPLPVPIKAIWFVGFYVAIELFSTVSTASDGVAHAAHLGGMAFGFFLIRYWRRHPTAGYGPSRGQEFFDRLRNGFDRRRGGSSWGNGFGRNQGSQRTWGHTGTNTSTNNAAQNDRQSDWDYNARKRANQDEIDRILDKIRKSGYDSLSKEEKQKLFDSSND